MSGDIKLFFTTIGTIIGEVVEVEEHAHDLGFATSRRVQKLKNPAMVQVGEGGQTRIMPMALAAAADQLFELNLGILLFTDPAEPLPALARAHQDIFGTVKVAPASALAGLQIAAR